MKASHQQATQPPSRRQHDANTTHSSPTTTFFRRYCTREFCVTDRIIVSSDRTTATQQNHQTQTNQSNERTNQPKRASKRTNEAPSVVRSLLRRCVRSVERPTAPYSLTHSLTILTHLRSVVGSFVRTVQKVASKTRVKLQR